MKTFYRECPICKTKYYPDTRPLDFEAVEKLGCCLLCDHIDGEITDSQKQEVAEDITTIRESPKQ